MSAEEPQLLTMEIMEQWTDEEWKRFHRDSNRALLADHNCSWGLVDKEGNAMGAATSLESIKEIRHDVEAWFREPLEIREPHCHLNGVCLILVHQETEAAA